MTSIDNTPYIVSAKSFFDSHGKLRATLLLASPIDDEFLTESLGVSHEEHLVALLSSEKETRILTSSNLEKLPAGTLLDTLKDRYLVTGKEFFDYGASEVQIKFVSFVLPSLRPRNQFMKMYQIQWTDGDSRLAASIKRITDFDLCLFSMTANSWI